MLLLNLDYMGHIAIKRLVILHLRLCLNFVVVVSSDIIFFLEGILNLVSFLSFKRLKILFFLEILPFLN